MRDDPKLWKYCEPFFKVIRIQEKSTNSVLNKFDNPTNYRNFLSRFLVPVYPTRLQNVKYKQIDLL